MTLAPTGLIPPFTSPIRNFRLFLSSQSIYDRYHNVAAMNVPAIQYEHFNVRTNIYHWQLNYLGILA